MEILPNLTIKELKQAQCALPKPIPKSLEMYSLKINNYNINLFFSKELNLLRYDTEKDYITFCSNDRKIYSFLYENDNSSKYFIVQIGKSKLQIIYHYLDGGKYLLTNMKPKIDNSLIEKTFDKARDFIVLESYTKYSLIINNLELFLILSLETKELRLISIRENTMKQANKFLFEHLKNKYGVLIESNKVIKTTEEFCKNTKPQVEYKYKILINNQTTHLILFENTILRLEKENCLLQKIDFENSDLLYLKYDELIPEDLYLKANVYSVFNKYTIVVKKTF